jgi:hypothetical protein
VPIDDSSAGNSSSGDCPWFPWQSAKSFCRH